MSAERDGPVTMFTVRGIAPEAIVALCEYSWPGNVRQLENVIERLVVTGRRETIHAEDLPPEIRSPVIGMRPRRERRRTVADAATCSGTAGSPGPGTGSRAWVAAEAEESAGGTSIRVPSARTATWGTVAAGRWAAVNTP